MNIIVIKGRLTKTPEVKETQSGVKWCRITVAVDRNYIAKGEEKMSDFFDCTFWRQGADFVGKYFEKGQEILVSGEMQSRKWTAEDGSPRTSWEVQNCHAEFCGTRRQWANKVSEESEVATETLAADEVSLIDDADLPFMD